MHEYTHASVQQAAADRAAYKLRQAGNECSPAPNGGVSKINGTRGSRVREGPKRPVNSKVQGFPFKASHLNQSGFKEFLERP